MHRNARLTGRSTAALLADRRWLASRSRCRVHGDFRDRAYVWWRRYQSERLAGLEDRSGRPHGTPSRTKASRERRIVHLRRKRGLGPARIAGIAQLPASTVHAVLERHGLNRLDCLDRPTRAPIRRMEMTRQASWSTST